MIILKIVAVLLGLVVIGFACFGASCFFNCIKEYEREAKYFLDEK